MQSKNRLLIILRVTLAPTLVTLLGTWLLSMVQMRLQHGDARLFAILELFVIFIDALVLAFVSAYCLDIRRQTRLPGAAIAASMLLLLILLVCALTNILPQVPVPTIGYMVPDLIYALPIQLGITISFVLLRLVPRSHGSSKW